MVEAVVPIDIGVVWEPNAPYAVMAADDGARTALAMMPRDDDPDQNVVLLVWTGSHHSVMTAPNDEAITGHHLYERGLDSVLWIGRVDDSELIARLERQNRVHPSHDPAMFADLVHHIVLTKETVVEVVARTFEVRRVPGSTADAAIRGLRVAD